MQEFTAEDRDAIRKALTAAGVTHDKVALACRVGRSTVSLWLAGEISSPALDKAIPAFTSALSAVSK